MCGRGLGRLASACARQLAACAHDQICAIGPEYGWSVRTSARWRSDLARPADAEVTPTRLWGGSCCPRRAMSDAVRHTYPLDAQSHSAPRWEGQHLDCELPIASAERGLAITCLTGGVAEQGARQFPLAFDGPGGQHVADHGMTRRLSSSWALA